MKTRISKNVLLQRYVGQKESEDIMIHYEFYSEEEVDEDYPHTIVVSDTHYCGENSPLQIDEALRIIQGMKEKGATHIEIDYHVDHGSYIFNGVELRKATDEEIAKETVEMSEIFNTEMKEKIEDYKRKIEILENELQ